MKLTVNRDTVFKLSTADSSALADDEKAQVTAGVQFDVHSHLPASNNHVKVALKDAALGSAGRNTWFVFCGHVTLEGNEPDNNPNDPPVPASDRREGNILLPNGNRVDFKTPVLQGGNFYWGEVMQWDLRRVPPNMPVFHNIIKSAKVMEEIRSIFGNRSISVNSWYRPPAINRAVGGARSSRHLSGDALDFNVSGISPHDVRSELNGWWGSRGGLASANTFTHIDCRGYRARWRY